MGRNDGQLGGYVVGESTLTKIGDSNEWTKVACNTYNMVALKKKGTLWMVGYIYKGPVRRKGFIKKLTSPNPKALYSDIACGVHHTVAIKRDGTLWGLGFNSEGQIGGTGNKSTFTQIETANDWVQVACGAWHTVVLKKDGTLWGLGRNNYGQIGGTGGTGDKNTLTQIGTSNDWIQVACGVTSTIALNNKGEAYTAGYWR
jgi:alpha-tubulin suppressor-like RCC1 family protein